MGAFGQAGRWSRDSEQVFHSSPCIVGTSDARLASLYYALNLERGSCQHAVYA
jgi:hypothetical protein